jgi:hypothetical protein
MGILVLSLEIALMVSVDFKKKGMRGLSPVLMYVCEHSKQINR